MNIQSLFLDAYEASRQRFRDDFRKVQALWPEARLESRPLKGHADLTLDWIWADARATPQHRLVFVAGLHGIEGYVGAAMEHLFVQEFLPCLDPNTTGLLLVHALNPWGMVHYRRTNAHNVDLNRNFLPSAEAFDETKDANPAYARLNGFLNPTRPVRSWTLANLQWSAAVARVMISPGTEAVRQATLLGQYRFPQGIYYGGERWQAETKFAMALYRQAWQGYTHTTLLDMHTGYGPAGQMTIVNAAAEPKSPDFFKKAFRYPHVVAANPDEFYTISGDMIEWVYNAASKEAPNMDIYATTFEFGTFGDAPLALVRSLRAMVMENRAFWHGASETARKKIAAEFRALFFPSSAAWRASAVAQARRALEGVLQARGIYAYKEQK